MGERAPQRGEWRIALVVGLATLLGTSAGAVGVYKAAEQQFNEEREKEAREKRAAIYLAFATSYEEARSAVDDFRSCNRGGDTLTVPGSCQSEDAKVNESLSVLDDLRNSIVVYGSAIACDSVNNMLVALTDEIPIPPAPPPVPAIELTLPEEAAATAYLLDQFRLVMRQDLSAVSDKECRR